MLLKQRCSARAGYFPTRPSPGRPSSAAKVGGNISTHIAFHQFSGKERADVGRCLAAQERRLARENASARTSAADAAKPQDGSGIQHLRSIYTGKIFAESDVVDRAPAGDEHRNLEFFNVSDYTTCDQLEIEYKHRGLRPADLFAVARWNEANPDQPLSVGTQWRDVDGWAYAAFNCWNGERRLQVLRGNGGWGHGRAFAGIRIEKET